MGLKNNYLSYNAIISGTAALPGSNWKIIFVIISPFIKKGKALQHNMTITQWINKKCLKWKPLVAIYKHCIFWFRVSEARGRSYIEQVIELTFKPRSRDKDILFNFHNLNAFTRSNSLASVTKSVHYKKIIIQVSYYLTMAWNFCCYKRISIILLLYIMHKKIMRCRIIWDARCIVCICKFSQGQSVLTWCYDYYLSR